MCVSSPFFPEKRRSFARGDTGQSVLTQREIKVRLDMGLWGEICPKYILPYFSQFCSKKAGKKGRFQQCVPGGSYSPAICAFSSFLAEKQRFFAKKSWSAVKKKFVFLGRYFCSFGAVSWQKTPTTMCETLPGVLRAISRAISMKNGLFLGELLSIKKDPTDLQEFLSSAHSIDPKQEMMAALPDKSWVEAALCFWRASLALGKDQDVVKATDEQLALVQ